MTEQRLMTTRQMTLSALLIAVTVVCSQIQIPLVVPINLGLFAVYLTGALLGGKYGTLTIVTYVLCGALGLPVFAGFAGGPAALVGKTGGYILGYILAAAIVGFGSERGKAGFWPLCGYMFLGMLACYAFGTMWFMVLTGLDLWTSMLYCVLPFIPGDLMKIALAAFITGQLRPVLGRF